MATNTNTKAVDPSLAAAQQRLIERRKQVKITVRPAEPQPRTQESVPELIGSNLLKLAEEARVFTARVELFVRTNARQVTCEHHGALRKPDLLESVRESRQAGKMVLVYAECPQCLADRTGPAGWLFRAGVPKELLTATLDNWQPRTAADQSALAQVKHFARRRVGCLVLLGMTGLGKSHLAVGVMAYWHTGFFITQDALLKQMRDHDYRGEGDDVVEKAKRTKLLVLDEVGLSIGGKDEQPLLYEVLAHRHANFMPSILTGNLTTAQLPEVLGGRLWDRIRQSAFRILELQGESMRLELRNHYGRIER